MAGNRTLVSNAGFHKGDIQMTEFTKSPQNLHKISTFLEKVIPKQYPTFEKRESGIRLVNRQF